MQPKIVGMITSYKGLSQRDWLWQQTPHPFGVWGNLQMLATAQEPDFLLLYNFNDFPPPTVTEPWWQFWQRSEPVPSSDFQKVPKERTIALVREPPLPEQQPNRIANYKEAQKYCGYVSGPDDFAPIPDYMPAIWYHHNSFRELNEMEPPPKTRRLSWITSGINRTASHRQRLVFLRQLQDTVNFDLYGRRLPSWASGMGSVKNKWHAIAPYHYNLAIENYADNQWYVSEKLWDALLAWCLPIYYGGTAADKLLPTGSFLRLPSLDEQGIAYIKEVSANLDAWHDALEAIAEARQIILHELNLLNWLSNLTQKLG